MSSHIHWAKNVTVEVIISRRQSSHAFVGFWGDMMSSVSLKYGLYYDGSGSGQVHKAMRKF